VMQYCNIRNEGEAVTLCLEGHWTIFALPEIKRELSLFHPQQRAKIVIDGKNLASFDTAAAWYLNDLLENLKKPDSAPEMRHFQDSHRRIFDKVSRLPPPEGDRRRRPRTFAQRTLHIFSSAIVAVGRNMTQVWEDALRGVDFFGTFLVSLAQRIFRPGGLRLRSVAFHVNEIGIKAVPIIALMAFSIAFVMGYQGAFQLQKFGATVYTINLVALSILREMGVLITAIMVAGRSGSAFAAQLGTMKLNEEVDALETMGVPPFEVLVLPRLMAILVALPLLTVLADGAGLIGGYVFSASYLGYSGLQFLARLQSATDMRQFAVGLVKAPVFALLIGLVGCMQGLRARGSAEDVGRKTITAVVQSIFLVIVADAVFSVIFTKLGI
ncbi:MAG: ABC transporter permease, partial [Alphaproteobacteria bacterium]|nr:ABC transporter permease [Alphaproteobacteria bacterium]